MNPAILCIPVYINVCYILFVSCPLLLNKFVKWSQSIILKCLVYSHASTTSPSPKTRCRPVIHKVDWTPRESGCSKGNVHVLGKGLDWILSQSLCTIRMHELIRYGHGEWMMFLIFLHLFFTGPIIYLSTSWTGLHFNANESTCLHIIEGFIVMSGQNFSNPHNKATNTILKCFLY